MDWERIINNLTTDPVPATETFENAFGLYDELASQLVRINPELSAKMVAYRIEAVVRLVEMAEKTDAVTWESNDDYDADRYAAMTYAAFYLSHAWGTVANPLPPNLLQVIAYALVVGLKIGAKKGRL